MNFYLVTSLSVVNADLFQGELGPLNQIKKQTLILRTKTIHKTSQCLFVTKAEGGSFTLELTDCQSKKLWVATVRNYQFKFYGAGNFLEVVLDTDLYRISLLNLDTHENKTHNAMISPNLRIQFEVDQRTLLKDGFQCLVRDDECEVSANNCDQCENSYYPTFSATCLSHPTYVCGVNNCGARGEQACVKEFADKKDRDSNCEHMLKHSYCQVGLNKVCTKNTVTCE